MGKSMINEVSSFFVIFALVGVLIGTSFFLLRGLFLNDRNYSRSEAMDMLAKITLFLGLSIGVGLLSHLIVIPFHVWHLVNGLVSYKFFGEWMTTRFEHKRGVFVVYMLGFFAASTLISFMMQSTLDNNASFVFTNIYPLLKGLILSINENISNFLSFLAWLGGLRLSIRGEF